MYKNYKNMTVDELPRLLALGNARVEGAKAIGDGHLAPHWAAIANEVNWSLTYGELR